MNNRIKIFILIFTCFVSWELSVSNAAVFYSINEMHGISMRETASICKDKSGFIWASSKTGIIRITDVDYKIYQIPFESTDIINVKLAYKDSKLYAFSNNGQIFLYNIIYDRFDPVINLSKALNTRYLNMSKLNIDDDGALWLALSSGLYKYKDNKLTAIADINSEVYYIEWFAKNELLFANSEGIFSLNTTDLTSKTVFVNSNISPFQVSKLYYDPSDKKLWVGTMSNGLYHYDFNENKFSNIYINNFPKQPILAIEETTDSTIMIGIDGQGIWELNKRNDRVLNIYKESDDDPLTMRGNGVYDIYCDENKRVWVCTYSGGISYFDQASPLVNHITHQTNNSNSLVNNDVNDIVEDKNGNLWFATNNGISKWNKTTDKWISFYKNAQNQAQVFLSLCEDNNGHIWAGTYSSGVYVLNEVTGKEIAHYSRQDNNNSVISNFVIDIYKDSNGDIWIGGVHGEVICYLVDKNEFKTYSNLPVNSISELSEDTILIGCTYGLCELDKAEGTVTTIYEGCLVHDVLPIGNDVWICTSGEGLIHLNIETDSIVKYTTRSGLPSNFINTLLYSNGFLWLATENGLCRFNTETKSVDVYPSILSLSQVSFNRNASYKLKNGQLAFGSNNGAVIFDPQIIQQVKPQGKIYLQDLLISGTSIRDSSILNLTRPLDSLREITLHNNQKTLTLELLPIGMTDNYKFSWLFEGLDKDWSLPSDHRFLTYTNIPIGEFNLSIRLYDSSLSRVIDERTFRIIMEPPFWKTWWFILIVFIFLLGITYFSMRFYINSIRQYHANEKIRFFTNTAHDIRTALTLIKAPIDELKKETKLSGNGKQYLQLAIDQARYLSMVVTQLMDFQKVDIGKEKLTLSKIDIVKLIRYRLQMFESFAMNHNVKLVFKTDATEYFTGIDELMIEKVIDNLISNAIKYSKTDSDVEVTLQTTKNTWSMDITDHGIGISKIAQRHLFKEFYRGENAINNKIVGSGIGLLLVKNYVTMHDGKISFKSIEDVGTTFTLSIPYKEFETRSLDEFENATEIQLESSEDVFEADSELKGMHILIVEDNDDLRNFMQLPLGEEFKVTTAEDGAQAWEIIREELPDLIVTDVMMPRMDGFELCKLIKSTYETSHIPVIMLTALSDKSDQLTGLGLGADNYLIKPFDMSLLMQRIKSIIRNRELIREKALKLIKGNNNEKIFANENNDKFVKRAFEVVQENIAETSFSKEEFAYAMNVSSSLLYKKIKNLTDQSPTDFIKSVRLNYALDLLQTGSHSVTEVSEMSGFSTAAYFSTVFKKHFGKSPTEILDK